MRPSSRFLLLLAAALLTILTLYLAFQPPRLSAQEQIAQQIDAMRAAATMGDTSGIMHSISDSYQDSNFTDVEQLQFFLNRRLRNMGDVELSVSEPLTVVTGDTALSRMNVTASDRNSGDREYDQEVSLTWKLEPGYRDVVIPARTWRIISATYGSMDQE